MSTREELVKAMDDAKFVCADAYDAAAAADAAYASAADAADAAFIALEAYDKETCHSFVSGPDDGGVKCKTHPDAPHGFLRNSSHNAGRYVCQCEHWEEL